MIFFSYTQDYKDTALGKDPISYNPAMYAMGDKYDMQLLKDLASIKFKAALGHFDITMTPSLLKAIPVIYNTTLPSDRTLRDAIQPVLKANKTYFRQDEQFMGLVRSAFADSAFTVDVIDAWANWEESHLSDPVTFHENYRYCKTCRRDTWFNRRTCDICLRTG